MKNILSLCLSVSLLIANEVHFSFDEETPQKLEIPFDTTFRLYSAPIELIDTRQTPLLKLIFNGCASRVFRIDNIRFPSNAYIDFENGLPDLTYSDGISQVSLVQHPSDSGFVLQVEFDPNHLGRDTLKIQQPGSWYPAVPDRVGLEFQADATVPLIKYYMPPEIARHEVSVPDWGYHVALSEKYSEVVLDDMNYITVRERRFSLEYLHEAYNVDHIYTYSLSQPSFLERDGILFDFDAGLDEPVQDDSLWGSWLGFEMYQEVLGEIVFVKIMDPFGPIGYRLYFGYGMGLIREEFPGTSVHADLVGFQDGGDVTGEMNLPISLSLGVGYDSQSIKIFPPDTSWYHYTVPISELYRFTQMPIIADSLQLTLCPEILVENHDYGSLLFNRLSLWENENLVYDFGTRNHNEWSMIAATNGSQMGWQYSQEMPPDGLVLSSHLSFGNSWQGGTRFAGFTEYLAHFETPITLENTALKFWMKQPYIMTGVEEYEAIIPEEYGISKAYPNPFNGEVTLSADIPNGLSDIQIIIYDIQGRVVWSRSVDSTNNNKLQYTWAGKDLTGRDMDSGLYIVTLQIEGQVSGQIQKIIMLK